MTRRRLGLVLVVLALSVTACRQAEFELEATSDPGAGTLQPGDPDIDAPMTPSHPGDGSDVAVPADVVEAALLDVEDFWSRTFEEVYGDDYVPIRGGFFAYGPQTSLPPCGLPGEISYDDIAGNAFYCPSDDLIAWDEVNLIPQLQSDFGPFTVGIVMAHEFGHAIQARAQARATTITLELQADCFAGAWTADVSDGNARFFATSGEALDASIGGFISIRDQLGTSASDPNAHGSGFDRVSAFQDGFEGGAGACAEYEEHPPEVVQIPFASGEDFENRGNLPLDDLLPLLLANLETYYGDLFASEGLEWDPVDELAPLDPATAVVTCGGEVLEGAELEFAGFYCADDDTIYLDNENLVPELAGIGDFAFGAEVARQYANAALFRLDVDGDDRSANLAADCLAGAFSGAVFDDEITTADNDGDGLPDFGLALSPGDLDEAIRAFLIFGADGERGQATGTAFERTAAFRAGFFDGSSACRVIP